MPIGRLARNEFWIGFKVIIVTCLVLDQFVVVKRQTPCFYRCNPEFTNYDIDVNNTTRIFDQSFEFKRRFMFFLYLIFHYNLAYVAKQSSHPFFQL